MAFVFSIVVFFIDHYCAGVSNKHCLFQFSFQPNCLSLKWSGTLQVRFSHKAAYYHVSFIFAMVAKPKTSYEPPRSLISTFVVHYFSSIISILAKSKIARLAYVAEQTGLSLTWSQTLKTGFLMTRLIL